MSSFKAFVTAAFAALAAMPAAASDFSALARVVPGESRITDAGRGGAELQLGLSQGVPYRLYTLDQPPRLVLDFQEVDWTGLQASALLQGEQVKSAHFGTYVPGWSRLVLELSGPMQVDTAALSTDTAGTALLNVRLLPADPEGIAASAGAPKDARWDAEAPLAKEAAPEGAGLPPLVVLDPGHGGIDPGAEAEGAHGHVVEKELILGFAYELSDVLVRSGRFRVQLTRSDDYFVSLEKRIALAHQAGADVFISLHADSLADGRAHGATVHVLSRDASDVASAKLAERHDRADLLAGADLSEADDRVTGILLDLARQETQPRSEALAQELVTGMAAAGGPMNRRPLRKASFSVLKAADIPSVLVELGFLSSARDLANLQDPAWRAKMARGIRDGLIAWQEADAAKKALVRQ
jgi:N-acetylmuramoyl-L-alanine amidase